MAMTLSRATTAVLAISVVVGALLLATDSITPKTTMARDRSQTVASGERLPPGYNGAQAANDGEDHLLSVQLWTVLAAVSAMGLGLVLFLVRVALGHTQPPVPPPEHDSPHH
jgi:hypothetical protein